MNRLHIRNATVVTMNDAFDIVEGDVLVEAGRIAAVGVDSASYPADRVIDAAGRYLLPGFVQTHIHLCQTLFRGLADDLPLLEWLKRRVWPLEAAHRPDTLRASARLAIYELLRTGTTTVLTMETVHDTEAVIEAAAETGIRATIGKCLMDRGGDAPSRLHEHANRAMDASHALRKAWHGEANGRIRTALAPRFALSCTRELLEAVADDSRQHGALVHTHASENRDEVALVARETGMRNVEYLAEVGLATPHLCTAHCVWVDDREIGLMAETGIHVLHYPGSNLKLGSGIAPIAEMRRRGVSVSLGTDGAACNNRLDMFDEMRLAATLQAMARGPGSLAAREVLWMATRGGARALGLEGEIGSVEPGKRADLVLVDRDSAHLAPGRDPYSTLVYSARGTDVCTTIVDGDVLVDAHASLRLDPVAITADARTAAQRLVSRAGL